MDECIESGGRFPDQEFGHPRETLIAIDHLPAKTEPDKGLGYLREDQHKNLSTEVVEIRRKLLAFNKKLRS